MNRLAPINLLTSVLILGLVLIAGEVWGLQQSRVAAGRAVAALEQKKQERDWLARQTPALNADNEAAIVADLAATNRLLVELRAALQGRDPTVFSTPAPAKPIDAYFALADFVEKLRIRAAQAQVVLKPDERFGFATHTNEGPVIGQLSAVHQQQLATRYLVETLLESRPLALLAVRRERPDAGGPRVSGDRADDFFVLDPALSIRQPGQVGSVALRVEFTGQTAALRNFLNSLAAFRQPVVVRSVEVEPLAIAAGSGATPPAAAAGSPVPLVRPSLSKFAVTVEFVLLADNPVTSAP
jgi:hypothetical protein